MAFMTPMMLAGISTAMTVVGTLSQAGQASASANYNAQLAEQNAIISRQQGVAAQDAQARQSRQKMGLMIANYGASGVDSGTGSPLDVLADSAAQSKLDNLTIGYNAGLKSQGYSNTAALDRAQGDNALTSGLLTAIGQGAGGYTKYKSMGAGTPIPTYDGMTTSAGGMNI